MLSNVQNRDDEAASLAGSKEDVPVTSACVDFLDTPCVYDTATGRQNPILLSLSKNVCGDWQQPSTKPSCGIGNIASSKKATADTGDGKTDGEDLKSTVEKHGCKESPENTVEKHGVRVRVRVRVGLGLGSYFWEIFNLYLYQGGLHFVRACVRACVRKKVEARAACAESAGASP